MIDPNLLNINKVPKQFCDGAFCGLTKEAFMFVLTSGEKITGFATTPTQMKQISKMFNTQIQEYEKKYGLIEVQENVNLIPSPFQKL